MRLSGLWRNGLAWCRTGGGPARRFSRAASRGLPLTASIRTLPSPSPSPPAVRFRAAAKLAGDRARHFEHGLVGGDADRADLVLGDVAAAAEQRQQPARVGIVPAADVHPEPDRVLEAGARARPAAAGSRDACADRPAPRRPAAGAMGADQCGGDLLRGLRSSSRRRQRAILLVDLDRREQGREQPLLIVRADLLGRRRLDPLGLDPRAAQHRLRPRLRRG